jgi:endosialidase-like protein/Regulator of Chromosome Condensation (RCC1) repeat protein
MRNGLCRVFRASVAIVAFIPQLLSAQVTAFTYQGRLNDNGQPANGNYDFQFRLYDSPTNGGQVPVIPVSPNVPVSNGLFTTGMDFGSGVFNGTTYYLEIAVQPKNGGGFTTLSPRQVILPVPGAVFASSASNLLGTLPTAQLSGTIAAGNITGAISVSQLPATVVTNGASGVNISGTFTGNGSGVTNVPFNSLLTQNTSNSPIVVWGRGSDGQTNIPPGLGNVIAATAGEQHIVAVKSDGTVVAWGTDNYGVTEVPAGLSNVVAVAAGAYHDLALKNDGTVVAWGYNCCGQTDVPAGLGNVMSIAVGTGHCLALKSNGTVVAWGDNSFGQTNTPAGLSNVVAIAAGGSHNLALKNNGTVIAWGINSDGQTNIPSGLSNVVAVAAGDSHNLALKSDGTVVAWGRNISGQTNVPGGLNNVTAVAGGHSHSLALKSDGTVVAWGFDLEGQTDVPAGLGNVIAIASGCDSDNPVAIQKLVFSHVFNGNIQVNGFLSGNGSLLTALNANSLLVGTVADARLSPNVALLNASQSFAGPNTFANAGNSFSGNGAGLTSLSAGNVTSGVLPDARLSANVPRLNASQTFSGANIFNGNVGISTPSPQAQLNVNGNVRIDASSAPYTEGLSLNLPTDMLGGGYGGIDFHNTARGAAYSASTIKWGIYYNYIPEIGTTGNGLSFVQNNANTRLYLSANGNVGIANNSPQQLLHLSVTSGHGEGMRIDSAIVGDTPAIYLNHTGTGGRNFRIASYGDNSTAGSLRIRDETAGAYRITMDASGEVGIGTTVPDATLTVNGTADKPGGGSWGTFSDARLKDVGENFTNGLESLEKIEPVHYHYKTGNPLSLPPELEYIGVVAQQVQDAVPEAVTQSKTGYLVVNNDPIIWTVVNAVKDLNQKLETGNQKSENRIQKLEAENAELKVRLEKLERLLNSK